MVAFKSMILLALGAITLVSGGSIRKQRQAFMNGVIGGSPRNGENGGQRPPIGAKPNQPNGRAMVGDQGRRPQQQQPQVAPLQPTQFLNFQQPQLLNPQSARGGIQQQRRQPQPQPQIFQEPPSAQHREFIPFLSQLPNQQALGQRRGGSPIVGPDPFGLQSFGFERMGGAANRGNVGGPRPFVQSFGDFQPQTGRRNDRGGPMRKMNRAIGAPGFTPFTLTTKTPLAPETQAPAVGQETPAPAVGQETPAAPVQQQDPAVLTEATQAPAEQQPTAAAPVADAQPQAAPQDPAVVVPQENQPPPPPAAPQEQPALPAIAAPPPPPNSAPQTPPVEPAPATAPVESAPPPPEAPAVPAAPVDPAPAPVEPPPAPAPVAPVDPAPVPVPPPAAPVDPATANPPPPPPPAVDPAVPVPPAPAAPLPPTDATITFPIFPEAAPPAPPAPPAPLGERRERDVSEDQQPHPLIHVEPELSPLRERMRELAGLNVTGVRPAAENFVQDLKGMAELQRVDQFAFSKSEHMVNLVNSEIDLAVDNWIINEEIAGELALTFGIARESAGRTMLLTPADVDDIEIHGNNPTIAKKFKVQLAELLWRKIDQQYRVTTDLLADLSDALLGLLAGNGIVRERFADDIAAFFYRADKRKIALF